ncbi:MAG: Ig-like domain-containing protein, partial [Pricia sp.]
GMSITFTPAAGSTETARFEYTINDGNLGNDANATITVTVEGDAVAVTGITVLPETATVTVGDTQQLTAVVQPNDATEQGVQWSSGDINVVTVDNNGRVTAVGPGTAVIRATSVGDASITDTSTVTVENSPVLVTGIAVSSARSSVPADETEQFTATITPANADNRNVTWSSSDTGVATVNVSGLITAVSDGTATITATATDGSAVTGSAGLTVTSTAIPVTGISVFSNRSSIPDDETEQFTAMVTPANADNRTVTWSSTNTGVATVNALSGLVTAVSVGNTDIIASATDGSGISGFKQLQVTASSIPVSQITVNSSRSSIPDDETEQFSAIVEPGDATDRNVVWTSSNTSVATVNVSTGRASAVSAGITNIIATATDGSGVSGTKQLRVTVSATPPATITYNRNTGVYTAPSGSRVTVTLESSGTGKGNASVNGSGNASTSWNGLENEEFFDSDSYSFFMPSSESITFTSSHNMILAVQLLLLQLTIIKETLKVLLLNDIWGDV